MDHVTKTASGQNIVYKCPYCSESLTVQFEKNGQMVKIIECESCLKTHVIKFDPWGEHHSFWGWL